MNRKALHQLQGFLLAMEGLNQRYGNCTMFGVDELASSGTVLDALRGFNAVEGQPEDAFEVRLVLLLEWRKHAVEMMSKWLFSRMSLDWVPTRLQAEFKAHRVDSAMQLLDDTVGSERPREAFSVAVSVPSESKCDDFPWMGDHLVLVCGDARLYLHLGPAD